MSQTVWKGDIVLGQVAIPIRLTAAARRREGISLNQLHKHEDGTGHKISQVIMCNDHEPPEMVEREKLVRGCQVNEASYLIIPEDDIKELGPTSTRIVIAECVPLGQVDPVYLADSYHVSPQPSGERSYAVLAHVLGQKTLAGIGRWISYGREHVVMLQAVPCEAGLALRMHTLFFSDEVRPPEVKDLPMPEKVELAACLVSVKGLTKRWNPAQYFDGYRNRLQEMLKVRIDSAGGGFRPRPEGGH